MSDTGTEMLGMNVAHALRRKTNTYKRDQRPRAKADFGENAFSAKTIRRPKPAPDLFLHAAQTMGFSPDRCAVVEDTTVGVTAGIAAGMTVFAYCPLERATMMAALGATPFHVMHDLPGHLGLG